MFDTFLKIRNPYDMTTHFHGMKGFNLAFVGYCNIY
jgi:hypothetical protein